MGEVTGVQLVSARGVGWVSVEGVPVPIVVPFSPNFPVVFYIPPSKGQTA